MKCPLKEDNFGRMADCQPDCAWLLKSVNRAGYCAIAVWAARQDDLPLEECMKFNYTRLEDE